MTVLYSSDVTLQTELHVFLLTGCNCFVTGMNRTQFSFKTLKYFRTWFIILNKFPDPLNHADLYQTNL